MSKEKEIRIEELRKHMKKKAIPFHQTFGSPNGLEVLAVLKAEFCPSELCQESPHLTVVRAAQRDVIEYIERMIKLREEDLT